jgi:hypothetical protein
VALPTAPTPPLNMSMAFVNDDDVQNHDAMTVDVQPLQGQYGSPADRVRAVPASLDDGHSVLPELLGTLSLYDHYSMDDGDYSVDALFKSAEDAAGNNHSSAVAEHAVFPVEEGLTFVPFVRGQLDCSKCRSVREVLHESGNKSTFFLIYIYIYT